MQKQSTSSSSYFFFVIATLVVLVAGCAQAPPATSLISTQTPQATPTLRPFPMATSTIQPQLTSVNDTWRDDTGYEGYYTGIVAITEYYTLLGNGLSEEAYKLLSISAQKTKSLEEFIQTSRGPFKTVEIVTIQPLRAWQLEQGITPIVIDREDQISFFVQIRARGDENELSGDLQTLFLKLILEDENWRINSFAENFLAPTPQPIAIPTLDPGSVPDRSYYDSIVVIAQFHVLFNNGLYEPAHQLLSPFRRHPQSLEEFVSDIETLGIIERRIVAIRPYYEGTLQFQALPTPDPISRRKFYARIYAEGKSGWAGSIPNGMHTYFITTVLEEGKWKIYSINTSP